MHVITTTAELAAACGRLANAPYVAVDTEFVRETTFWPDLCLIQMAGGSDELLVDPLAPGLDLAPFFTLMADPAVLKVFHAARQDLEIIFLLGKIIPKPLFDSQVAASGNVAMTTMTSRVCRASSPAKNWPIWSVASLTHSRRGTI